MLLPPPDTATDEPLHVVMRDRVLALIGVDAEAKERIITDAWSVLDADARLVYHKLIRGGFRIGVQRKTVAKALAEAGVMLPLHLIGIPDRYIEHGTREECLAAAGLDAAGLTAQIEPWWRGLQEPVRRSAGA